jgi:3-hydroxy-9,10-secoandrosta-1,3,5(10)-triene-9,17-dione monooxygenase
LNRSYEKGLEMTNPVLEDVNIDVAIEDDSAAESQASVHASSSPVTYVSNTIDYHGPAKTHPVVMFINEHADRLRELAPECEKLGRLTDETVQIMRDSGVMRLFQAKEYGGFEARPDVFVEAVSALAMVDPAAAWVSGVVGVHPWELSMADPKLREELWGVDQDTWIASPYALTGVARKVEGGYILNGRWQFSTGTDHSDWVVIGAIAADESGVPLDPFTGLHVTLPRKDYTIVDDSWDVIGLRGTGSKDLIVEEAFIPDYRVILADEAFEGTLAASSDRTDPSYKVPFWSIFPLGITAAAVGICEGGLDVIWKYQNDRMLGMGTMVKNDPYILHALAEAASEIAASKAHLLHNINEVYDLYASGGEMTFEHRARVRRDQIRAAWRAVSALDEAFARSGANALRYDKSIQRYWRDAHAGMNHAIHTSGTIYHASALASLGAEPPANLTFMI